MFLKKKLNSYLSQSLDCSPKGLETLVKTTYLLDKLFCQPRNHFLFPCANKDLLIWILVILKNV